MRDYIPFIPGCTSIAAIEKEAIKRTMKHFHDNKTKAAHSLGFSIRTLDARLKEYGDESRAADAANENAAEVGAVFLDKCRRGTKANAQDVTEQIDAKKRNEAASDEQKDRQEEFLRRCRDGAPAVAAGSKADGGKPAKVAAKEQPVSVPERQEVQGVLSDGDSPARARA